MRTLRSIFVAFVVAIVPSLPVRDVRADSVNSPNLSVHTDTNRAAGPGAGGVSIAVSTITVAETQTNEYASGAGKRLRVRAAPGIEIDPTSDVSAVSTTFGINGTAAGTAAILAPSGSPDEALTWTLTSGGTAGQDVIRIDGIRIRLRDGAAAQGTARTTLRLDTFAIGGSFTDQGIAATSITPGAADHLGFSTQPEDVPDAGNLLPAVAILDAGEHVVKTDPRAITLSFGANPGAATLAGVTAKSTVDGVATWSAGDALRSSAGGDGYTLTATHDGAPFASSDAVTSATFDVAPSFVTGLPARVLSVKPGGSFRLIVPGPIALPDPDRPSDDPTTNGATLAIAGPTWSLLLPLPQQGWVGLGPDADGSEGFRFKGVVCSSVSLKADGLKATCKVEIGTFTLPEPGPVTATLAIGIGRARYCVACGGTPNGKPEKAFARKNCAAPPTCP